MNPQKFFRATLYCLFLFTVSCTSVPSATPNIVRVPTSTLAPTSITPTLTPTSTSTSLPTVTPLPTATRLPTLTPLPTLAPDKAEALIEELLNTNAGCQLPCWWGITPGKTKWEEAEQFFKKFAREIYTPDETERFGAIYLKLPKQPKSLRQEYRIDQNGIILFVGISNLMSSKFSLSEVLTTHGKPNRIAVGISPSRDGNPAQVYIQLTYSTQGIVIIYSYVGSTFQDNSQNLIIKSCLRETIFGNRLALWSPQSNVSYDEVFKTTMGEDIFPDLQEKTGLSNDKFFITFRDPNHTECINVTR